MGDVIAIVNRNAEQAEFAAEVHSRELQYLQEDLELMEVMERRRNRTARQQYEIVPRRKKRKNRAALWAARAALVMSAAAGLMGLELMVPVFLLAAVIFYTLHMEQRGRSGIWQRICMR